MSRDRDSFAALRFMAALKAARDFGLDDATANRIALSFNARRPDVTSLSGHLADALIKRGAFRLPT